MQTTSVFLSSREERERLAARGIDPDESLRGLLARVLRCDVDDPHVVALASLRTGNPKRGRPRRAVGV